MVVECHVMMMVMVLVVEFALFELLCDKLLFMVMVKKLVKYLWKDQL